MSPQQEQQYEADMKAFERIECLQNRIISLYESISRIRTIKDETDAVFAMQEGYLRYDIALLEQEKKGLE